MARKLARPKIGTVKSVVKVASQGDEESYQDLTELLDNQTDKSESNLTTIDSEVTMEDNAKLDLSPNKIGEGKQNETRIRIIRKMTPYQADENNPPYPISKSNCYGIF